MADERIGLAGEAAAKDENHCIGNPVTIDVRQVGLVDELDHEHEPSRGRLRTKGNSNAGFACADDAGHDSGITTA